MTALTAGRGLATWALGFLSFPLAGIAGMAVVQHVDSPLAALIGGTVSGLVIGAGQALSSSNRLDLRRWVPATGVGMGLGLLAGASAVGFGTSLADLVTMGAITGIPLGLAQAVALPRATRRRWLWAVSMPALWALGWAVTTAIGVDVETQYTNFGAAGAITVTALAGLLLHWLLPLSATRQQSSTPAVTATSPR